MLLICISLLLSSNISQAQSGEFQIVNLTYDSITEQLYNHYSDKIAEASLILNGPEYFYDDIILGGNPFWGKSQFNNGSIFYNGIRYDDQEIGYDIYRDEVFISRYDQNKILSKVSLNVSMVGGFSISKNQFIRLTESENFENHPGTGFYELLYTGNLKVIVKRNKKIVPANDGGLYKYKFVISDKIYVLKDKTFNRIGSRKALFGLLSDQKKNLREFARENKQDIRDLEVFVKMTCSYYDNMKRSS